jgi:cell wall-associated NlpC family hydrolase
VAKPALRRVRPLVFVVALAAGIAAVPHLASASPDSAPATPTIASVQKELGQLALKNSQLVEQFDHARVVAQKRHVAAVKATRAAAAARTALDEANADMSRMLTAQYESTPLSAAGALLMSSNNETYLDDLDTMNIVSAHTAQLVGHMSDVKKAADSAAKTATKLNNQANADLAAVRKDKAAVQKQIDKYEATLGMLTAAQQAAFTQRINPAVNKTKVLKITSHIPASKRAKIAVRFALAQVGKPYVWGAAGPGSYDCSGLTMASWRAAGVSLPHSAADQYNYGTHVSMSQLSPGDLIFMYQPIGHVTIYIGDGMMVSAPQSGENVSVVPVSSFSSDIVGATHLG